MSAPPAGWLTTRPTGPGGRRDVDDDRRRRWRRRGVGRSAASAARGSVMVSRPRRLAAGQRPFRRPAHTTPAARRAPTQALPAGAASSRLIPARRPRDRCGLGGVINGHRSLVAPVDDSVHAVSATSDSPGSHRPVPLLRLVALRCEQACGEERDGADHGGVADHGEHRFTRRPRVADQQRVRGKRSKEHDPSTAAVRSRRRRRAVSGARCAG